MRPRVRAAAVAIALVAAAASSAQDRIPRPDFQSGYVLPVLQAPAARSVVWEYADVAVLAAALCVSTWLALRRRSRTGLFLLGAFSVLYFGFFRRGCVCAVGSVQNVLAALSEPAYAIPVTVVAFFCLPLLFALFAGRTFCGGVCPLGALQDLVLIRPVAVPSSLDAALRLLPPLYLGLAALGVLTGSDFLICRFDPFVGFFRLGAEPGMLILGAAILAVGTVIGRPYCRYLCPYSVLLKLASRLAWRHATITPTECVNCRLCESSCPFGAIATPLEERRARLSPGELRRFGVLLALVPVLGVGGALGGRQVSWWAALLDPTVRLARQVELEQEGRAARSTESEAFRTSGTSVEELELSAARVRASFLPLGTLFGAYAGVVMAGGAALTLRRKLRQFHEPHRALCVSCGRCFSSCPKEQELRRSRARG